VATVLRLVDLCKNFDSTPVVRNVNLEIRGGEFFTFLGPSGCGKTTTLRMIGGFEQPTSGRILLDGQDITDLPPFLRDVNTVFQNYALFPHMTVVQNVAFGLEMRGASKAEIASRVKKMLAIFGLTGLEKRKPAQLSGGQQQRVAVARSLVLHPRVLLLDEPLAALDAQLRRQIQIELKEIQKSSGVTFVYVTHDQEEALSLSDRIGVMREGVLEQVATPREVYSRPATRFVAEFVGENNILPVRVIGSQGGDTLLEMGHIRVVARDGRVAKGQPAVLAIRPENICLHAERPVGEGNLLAGVVRECLYSGTSLKVVLQLDSGQRLLVQTQAGASFQPEDRVWAAWRPENGRVLPDHPVPHGQVLPGHPPNPQPGSRRRGRWPG